MAHSNEDSLCKGQAQIINTIDLTISQNRQVVEDMCVEMFNIHTSLLTANEEITRLTIVTDKLSKKNEELELLLVGIEGLKKYNKYLKKMLDYTK